MNLKRQSEHPGVRRLKQTCYFSNSKKQQMIYSVAKTRADLLFFEFKKATNDLFCCEVR